MPNWTRGQLKNNAKMNFYKNYWMCVGMALILTLVLMMEPDGPKKEIMLKIRDYTDILPAYGYQGWLSSLFDGLGYWFGVLWSVFSLFIALVLLLIKIVVGNVVYVGGIRFFIQNRRENPSAGTIFFGFQNGNYGNIALTIFLKDLYTALWTLLLVVPGIIKHYEYRRSEERRVGRESDNAKRRGISDQPPHDDGAENGCIRIRSFIYRLVYFRKDFIWTGRIIFCKTLL